MPNITIYLDAEAMPSERALDDLTAQCTDLCIGTLRAALDNVHVIYVPVRRGRGHALFAEVLLREETFRTREVMAHFMEQLEDAIAKHTGHIARIRCFGFGRQHIHARN